jgi:hypothetical protein
VTSAEPPAIRILDSPKAAVMTQERIPRHIDDIPQSAEARILFVCNFGLLALGLLALGLLALGLLAHCVKERPSSSFGL